MKKTLSIAVLGMLFALNSALAGTNKLIRPFAPESLQQIKAAHAGKPFVVMVWSLDCAYCAESFAALAKIQKKHDVDIVTIAMDRTDSENVADMIRHKVAASGLVSEMWAFGAAPEQQLRYALDPKWRGETPRTYWFDANGKPTAYSGKITEKIAEKHL